MIFEKAVIIPEPEGLPLLREMLWLAPTHDGPCPGALAYVTVRPDAPTLYLDGKYYYPRRVWLPGGTIEPQSIMDGLPKPAPASTINVVRPVLKNPVPTTDTPRSRGSAGLKKAAQASFNI